ncbi:hypothetical protein [Paludisphaera soli]|uniref:hypothetical protein n=1 Tax=Paludisphaera soli TaxID=2712865 RepID=UPI0013EE31FE|nr:hypothetical protein [Paludisphaera soli]
MAEDLIIRLKMDRTPADKESEAFHQAERQRMARTLSDAEVAEKAKTAFIKRENAQRIAEAARATKTDAELAKEAAERQKRLAKEAADERKKQALEAARVEREEARKRAAEEREDERRRKSWSDRALSDAEVAERAKTAIVRRENLQRFDAVVRAHKTEMDLQRERGAAFSKLTSAVTSFAGQMVGLTSAAAVLGEIDAGFTRIRENVFRSTDLMQEFRQTLLELAALKDRIGDTSAEAVDTLRFQAQTGQTRADAVGLQEGILGVGEAAVRGGKIDQAGVRGVGVGVGRIQAAIGGDAGAFGYLAGQLLNQMPAGPGGTLDPNAVVDEFAAMQKLAQPGGPGFASLARQYAKASGYVGNGIASPREAMGAISALSISEGEEAGTRFQQLIRATVGSLGRNRKVTVAEGDDAIGTANYLKGIGATPAMPFMDIARLITADVDRAQAAAATKGEEFNPITYLQSRGYGNEETTNALMTTGNLIRSGTWDKTFAPTINDPNAGKGVQDEVNRKLATDPGLQGRQARAAADAARMSVGAGRGEVMRNLRQTAYARLLATPGNENLSSFEDIETSSFLAPRNIIWNERGRVGEEVRRMLVEQAGAQGVGVNQTWVPTPGPAGPASGYWSMPEDEQYRVAQELAGRGVNFGQIAGGSAVDAIATKLGQAADKLGQAAEKLNQPRPAPALGGRPVQPANP